VSGRSHDSITSRRWGVDAHELPNASSFPSSSEGSSYRVCLKKHHTRSFEFISLTQPPLCVPEDLFRRQSFNEDRFRYLIVQTGMKFNSVLALDDTVHGNVGWNQPVDLSGNAFDLAIRLWMVPSGDTIPNGIMFQGPPEGILRGIRLPVRYELGGMNCQDLGRETLSRESCLEDHDRRLGRRLREATPARDAPGDIVKKRDQPLGPAVDGHLYPIPHRLMAWIRSKQTLWVVAVVVSAP
jgi:hypothetical protein